jgi:hypothetical protein
MSCYGSSINGGGPWILVPVLFVIPITQKRNAMHDESTVPARASRQITESVPQPPHPATPVSMTVLLLALGIAATTFVLFEPHPSRAGAASDFASEQLKHPRVAIAKREKDSALRSQFRAIGLTYPPKRIFLRVFKEEQELQVWVGEGARYALFKSYPMCASSGTLGPKRRQGDGQIPEGCYTVTHFNPYSSLYLSMGIDYPNASDRKFADRRNPGGDIYIHGGCASIGCVSVTDDEIKEIYWLAAQTRGTRRTEIPVHIFPARMTAARYARLRKHHDGDRALLAFWQSLKPVYDAFEETRTVPTVCVDASGWYRVEE